jgi:hypothetical protein
MLKTKGNPPMSKVYVDYGDQVPPHPGDLWTRFVCISDTHSGHSGRELVIPPGDVLLHAGDLTSHGTSNELESTIEWLKAMPHPTKM